MKEVDRILRVDHAGEFAAINIYRSQLFIARHLYQDIVPILEEMLSHEKTHFDTFDRILSSRNIRHCYALSFWAFGGATLGFLTALAGRNAIWVCTDSIESTVLHHLEWQLDFLEKHDQEVHEAVLSIKVDEQEHRDFGRSQGSNSNIYRPIFWVVKKSTEFAIWLSTKL
ncbi:demethoxyubiquinone hydroxylase family protein [Pseudoalteromonas luteoviolacea]|uniref:demethoxyubiquinone hydroxylase family protein n=1 Tax=Pseudoalteromonas luteoviolacea TaxID=43657 RepID=UPI001B36BAB0|nr:demethoxyubiquinone hydroxylase family protein [Pseudoalteromonas luteoviolacea]MBQ4834890.1 demethoxyubiquinone hydroxylase family protein [Pseudoalteromonas luteoviolacea]